MLNNQFGQGPQEALNNSIILLEYKFAKAIKNLIRNRKPQVAFLEGHGELGDQEIDDLARSLSEFYELVRHDLAKELFIPKEYDVVVVAKPDTFFKESDKYKIDQYIMRGGKVLWFLETLHAEMDSLRGRNVFIPQPYRLNLEDQLFKYGVRVNNNLIQDLVCNPIPLVIGYQGDVLQTQIYPWYFFPLLTSSGDHPIVKNMDAVAAQFVSSIDTVGAKDIRKTVLLHSSQYTKLVFDPVRVNLGILKNPPDEAQFNKPYQAAAVLLEGEFESVFENRLAATTLRMIDTVQDHSFKERSIPTKMIIVADGDIIRNDMTRDGLAYPLGYDKYSDQTFANKDFILNALEYLIDDSKLIETRAKEIKLRM